MPSFAGGNGRYEFGAAFGIVGGDRTEMLHSKWQGESCGCGGCVSYFSLCSIPSSRQCPGRGALEVPIDGQGDVSIGGWMDGALAEDVTKMMLKRS